MFATPRQRASRFLNHFAPQIALLAALANLLWRVFEPGGKSFEFQWLHVFLPVIVLGVVVNVMAVVQHVGLLRRLRRGEPYQPSVWSLGVVVTLLLAAIGVVMTAYLFLGSH